MDELRGPLRTINITQATGAGGDVSALLRPPQGELWDVYIARGGHDGAGGLTCAWYMLDTIGPVTASVGGGAAQPRSFYTDVGAPMMPLRLHYNCYLAFQVTAIAAAKVVGIIAVIERIVGVDVQGA